jgi:hypothetical protein
MTNRKMKKPSIWILQGGFFHEIFRDTAWCEQLYKLHWYVWKQEQILLARLCHINNNDGMPKRVAGDFVQLLCLYSSAYMVFFCIFLHIVTKLKTTHLTLFSTTHPNLKFLFLCWTKTGPRLNNFHRHFKHTVLFYNLDIL